jgi:glucose-1-phosphate adenylyltransferase
MPIATEKMLTFILAGGRGQRLEPLSTERAKPMIPCGGSYKLIDFTLSNCLNSGLTNISVLVQHLSAELISYVHEGWRPYFPSTRGDTIQAIPPQYARGDRGYEGTADALFQNLQLVQQAAPEHVLVLSGDHMYKMDYRHLLEAHGRSGAALTVAAVEVPLPDGCHFGVIQVDAGGRIGTFREKPTEPVPMPGNPEACLASMGVYVFRPETLLEVLQQDAEDPDSAHDLGRSVVPRMIGSHTVHAFDFVDANRKLRKYWRDVGTLDSYYAANMDLVGVDPELNLYDAEWPVRSAPIIAPPPKFVHYEPDRTGSAINSIVSAGCIVSGARVNHSVLGPRAHLHSWSLVEDSILFEGVDVGQHARIRRAVVDEGVAIPPGEAIGHDLVRDGGRFTVTPSGIVVVSRAAAARAWGGAPAEA